MVSVLVEASWMAFILSVAGAAFLAGLTDPLNRASAGARIVPYA